MKLERPIVFIDLETTGLDLAKDRIIEISMIKLFSDNTTINYYKRINPKGKEIAEEAFEKHGIKLEDLVLCPTFRQVSQEIYDFIKDCDLGGYNCKRFDIPILIEEFLRVNLHLNIKSFKIIDVYKIYNKAEPRTLEGTYKRFFGESFEGAHSAEADITATIKILNKLEEIYKIPETVSELDKYALEDDGLDLENKIKKKGDKILFNFGKYKDKTIQEVYETDPRYYSWIINTSDMTVQSKNLFRNIVKYIENGSKK
ncbi:MAG: exonuclease domain-containing protein [Clostridia bacterium]